MPRTAPEPMTKSEILAEMALIEMSRRSWPGLDADEEDWAQARLMDLRSDLAVIEDAEADTAVNLPTAA